MRNFSPWRALAPVAIAAFSCAAAAQSDEPNPPSPQAAPSLPAQPDLRLDDRLPGASSQGDRDDAVPRDPTTPDADNGNGLGGENDTGADLQAQPQPPENPANPATPLFPANPKRHADPGQPGNPVTPTGARVG